MSPPQDANFSRKLQPQIVHTVHLFVPRRRSCQTGCVSSNFGSPHNPPPRPRPMGFASTLWVLIIQSGRAVSLTRLAQCRGPLSSTGRPPRCFGRPILGSPLPSRSGPTGNARTPQTGTGRSESCGRRGVCHAPGCQCMWQSGGGWGRAAPRAGRNGVSPLPPTGADGTPAQLARAHRTVLAAALIRPRLGPQSGPAHARNSGVSRYT